jgi:plastocyanin
VRRTERFGRVLGAVAVLAVTAVGCGGDDSTDTSTAASAPPVSLDGRVNDHGSTDLGSSTDLDLELDDSYFAPTFVKADPGSTVTVTLTNEGDAPHTFTIDDLGVDEQVQPGASATVEVELPEEGTLAYYCRFHVAGGMQGAFVVSDAAPTDGPATSSAGGSGGGFGY